MSVILFSSELRPALSSRKAADLSASYRFCDAKKGDSRTIAVPLTESSLRVIGLAALGVGIPGTGGATPLVLRSAVNGQPTAI